MSWDEMNQYERQRARHLVNGYVINQHSSESCKQFYERCKAECMKALRLQLAQVECMTFEQMFPKARASA